MRMRRNLSLFLLIFLFLSVFQPLLAYADENLLSNGGFEKLNHSGDPVDWYENAYYDETGYSQLSITSEFSHSGQHCAVIENASPNDARYITTVEVKPNSTYKLSGYILVDTMEEGGNGANLAVEGLYAFSDCLFDTNGLWQYVEWYGKTGIDQKSVTIGVRVGGYGAESIGKAYFDDISLEKVDKVPSGVTPAGWHIAKTNNQQNKTEDTEASLHQKHVLLCVAVAAMFVLVCLLFLRTQKWLAPKDGTFFVLISLTLATMIRIVLGALMEGYPVDISCFNAWSLRMANLTPLGFYSPDYFCDYPPGYMLLLWPVGLLLRAVLPLGNNALNLLILKSVPLICDMVTTLVLYQYGKKHLKPILAACVAALYAFNPAVLLNGAVWGQVDSVLAMLLILCAVYAMDMRWSVALPLYFVSVLVKPQALLVAPVAGIWLLMCLFGKAGKTFAEQRKSLLTGIGIGIAAALAIIIPFSIRQEKPIGWLVELYQQTLSSYAYATVNTANLYYLLAANWKPITNGISPLLPLMTAVILGAGGIYLILAERKKENVILRTRNGQLGLLLAGYAAVNLVFTVLAFTQPIYDSAINYGLYGYGLMNFGFAVVIVMMFHQNSAKQLPFYLALALLCVYTLGVKIHERYLFAALPLLLLAFARIRDHRLILLMALLSASTFINSAIVLDNALLFGSSYGHLNDDTLVVNILLCIINMSALLYGLWIGYSGLREAGKSQKTSIASTAVYEPSTPKAYEEMLLSPKSHSLDLNWKDWAIMGVTTVLYAVLAFTNLGSTVAPQHGWVSSSPEETITFRLEENTEFSVLYYAGVSNYNFSISVSEDGENWTENYPCEMREGLCYRWNYALKSSTSSDGQITFAGNRPEGVLWMKGQYLRLHAERSGLNLFEITARGRDGQTIPMQVIDHQNANQAILDVQVKPDYLLDEQNTCVGDPGWYNGTYFDEIYHARTAYEHLHGQRPYETTHPPLGKLLMALGIAIFGMTPFGWRFAGTFIGVLMLPALYLLTKQIFKRRDLSAFTMAAFALDLMHFTQTRIATIDSFPVFFILMSYWFMVRYLQTDVFAVAEDEQPVLLTKAFWKSLIPLAFSGMMMGLSIASKWIGIYSAIGLAVLFFTAVFRQYRAGNMAFSYAVDGSDESLDANSVKRLKGAQDHALSRIFITCGFCVLFFILVPCLVYYASYIPYLAPTGRVTVERVVQAQIGMLDYHSTPGLGMDHPFQSPWWQWPFILKPMWFAQDQYEPAGYASTIMCMGNPWVFYIGAICMAALLVSLVGRYFHWQDRRLTLQRGDGNLTVFIIAIAFFSQYLPWVLVPRSMYMYHYFASVPFIILATAWTLNHLGKKSQRLMRIIMAVYLVGALVFFIMFFPYASGYLTSTKWLDAMRWFSKLYY